MAVTLRNLSVLCYSNGFTLYHYKAHQVCDIMKPGYFNDADFLRAGDMIMTAGISKGSVKMVSHKTTDGAVVLGDVE